MGAASNLSYDLMRPHIVPVIRKSWIVAVAFGLSACGGEDSPAGTPAGGSKPGGSGGVPGGSGTSNTDGTVVAGNPSSGAAGDVTGGASTAGSGGAGGSEPGASGSDTGGVGTAGGSSAGASGSAGTNAAAGASGSGNACPLDLVGFATLEGGTTGGGNVAATVVKTQAELKSCATDSAPRVCRVQGTLTFSPFEEIRVASDKTIIGVGATAEIVMGGFFLGQGVHNVIIRNLTIRDSFIEGQYDEGGDEGGDRDGIQMDAAHHVWIDHCRFKHLGDGQIDSRKDTTFETVSWNILEDHNKAFGIGWTENVTAQITIHHNWLRNTTQRNPSTDNVLRAHLYNNLMENLSSYGNYARGGTNMVLENSVFKKMKDPHYYDTGTLVAKGNVYESVTGQKEQSGTTYSFFEPSKLYPYQLDATADVAALLVRCAGPRAELGQ